MTADSYIQYDKKITGGKPHIAGRRITAQDIVIWHILMDKKLN